MRGAFLIYGKANRGARPELISGASTAEGAVTFVRMKTEYGSKAKLYVVMEVVDPRRGFEDISNMRLVFARGPPMSAADRTRRIDGASRFPGAPRLSSKRVSRPWGRVGQRPAAMSALRRRGRVDGDAEAAAPAAPYVRTTA